MISHRKREGESGGGGRGACTVKGTPKSVATAASCHLTRDFPAADAPLLVFVRGTEAVTKDVACSIKKTKQNRFLLQGGNSGCLFVLNENGLVVSKNCLCLVS